MKLTLDIRFVLIVLVLLALFWLLRTAGTVLLPFLVGAFLAVLLEPLVRKTCEWNWPRWLGAILATVLAIIFIAGPIAAITPILVLEGADLIERLPTLLDNAAASVGTMAEGFGLQPPDMTPSALLGGEDGNLMASLTGRIAGSISGVLSALMFAILTPVALFFLLKDWPGVTEALKKLPPRRYADQIKDIASETNLQLARWMRGQAAVIVIMAVYHAAGLFLIGLNYSVAIGILTGLSAIIPVVGNLIFFSLALIVAANQFDTIWPILAVIAIYGTAQVLETAILAPRLIGDQLRLHPLWIMAGLLVGGTLFGILGALLALPAVAAISVLAKHGLKAWRDSEIYKDPGDAAETN
ncbi:AI-2E family transporter [Hyphobacterium marinum]|uniref:AI-2E family transporter n=1 Tax=Hyphobacterium marinum TaxID=3116574 RepID=A0ABU7LX87_9PROT|nr:AI-2E family transporter [Hyphobacterium sp. Y6023]MEE2566086.1 AI-2E family transporter [Hyphobacterium sp. Y6023]